MRNLDLFRLAMPGTRSTGPVATGDGDTGPDRLLQGRSILLVEDESLIAMLIQDALEDAGAAVIGPCYTLAECLAVIAAERIDGAILDVDLAGDEIYPAAEELRRRGVPFLFHTGHGHREELRRSFGEVAVCRKPAPVEELIDAIARISGGKVH